ncbi:MAG TPA: alpha/beta hydrolase [Candidatus Sulfotelmatobacter sp.]|nr:alpha/beta hydrolase [Candidatus Sulfotelmatobacter sp.]
MGEASPLAKNNVTVSGKADAARSMVFVHGFGTDQRIWADIVPTFRRDYRLILLDNAGAGSGSSEHFVENRYLSLNAYARDLINVCDALRLRNVVAVGHSVGGMICLLASIIRPDLIAKLVTICTSPRYLDDVGYHGGFAPQDIQALYEHASREYEEWANGFAAEVMQNQDRPELARRFAAELKAIPPNIALTVLCSILQSDHRADLHKVTCPTLLIQSLYDIAVPLSAGEYMHRKIPASKLEVIDSRGHLPHVSTPDQVIEAMRRFGL